MKKSLKYREIITDARRIVVKIGSRVLVQKTGRPDLRCMKKLAKELAGLQRSGYQIVIITSGAIGAGMEALGMKKRPTALPDLQMAAAVGQTRLMARYDTLFSALGCKVGQILMTHMDFQHKMRLTNARRTMETLIRNKVIPIINENDVVADEEIKADMALGDNDFLAALVVKLIRADLLIMLTTVDGVREKAKSGKSQRIRYIETINKSTFKLVSGSKSSLSKGGMSSKLKAAQTSSKAGCSTIIANGRQTQILTRVMNGEDVGTIVLASGI
ncbi:glutamate 5-kinase [Verrucomicrobiota bacterium]